jgi:hypothetical protein
MSLRPGKRGIPDAISAKIQPILQTSTDVLYRLAPSNNSGARYHNVTTSNVYGPLGIADRRAKPKSASFTCCPSADINKLCGFKSRCNIRYVWQHPTPAVICRRKLRTVGKGSPTRSAISSLVWNWSMNVFKSCATYSNTKYNPPGWACIISNNFTWRMRSERARKHWGKETELSRIQSKNLICYTDSFSNLFPF